MHVARVPEIFLHNFCVRLSFNLCAMTSRATITGFVTFQLKYFSDVIHYMYGRVHAKPKSALNTLYPDGRTLFLVNVPPDATQRELSVFFKKFGMVESVVFEESHAQEEDMLSSEDEDGSGSDASSQEDAEQLQDDAPRKRKRGKKGKEKQPVVKTLQISLVRQLRQSGCTAHVVFLDSSSLSNVFAQPQKPSPWPPSAELATPSGLAYYLAQYNVTRPPLSNVREHADTAIQAYDFAQERLKQKSKYKKGEAIVDEDGFTLVTRGGAYGKTLGGGAAVMSKRFEEEQEGKRARKKKKVSQDKEGFYAFQVREKKLKGKVFPIFDCKAAVLSIRISELVDIKRKFEDDKAKIAKLKASRTFKPY